MQRTKARTKVVPEPRDRSDAMEHPLIKAAKAGDEEQVISFCAMLVKHALKESINATEVWFSIDVSIISAAAILCMQCHYLVEGWEAQSLMLQPSCVLSCMVSFLCDSKHIMFNYKSEG
jgi:hypothetical protein